MSKPSYADFACVGCKKEGQEIEDCRIYQYNYKVFGKRCPRQGPEPPKVIAEALAGDQYLELDPDLIFWKDHIRKHGIKEEDIRDMTMSITQHGQIHPIVVKPPNEQGLYEGVVGRLRYEGIKRIRGRKVLARVHEFKTAREAREWQLVENTHRRDISAIERADAYQELYESMREEYSGVKDKHIVSTIAKRQEELTGEKQAERTIRAYIQISEGLPEDVKKMAPGAVLGFKHALELTRLKDMPEKQLGLAEEFASKPKPMTVQQLKNRVDEVLANGAGLGWEAMEVGVVPRAYRVLIKRGEQKRWVQIIRRFEKTPKDIVCPHFWELIWAGGCHFKPVCAWCYLQGTFRGDMRPWFHLREAVEKALLEFFDRETTPSLLNTGELADSLMQETSQPFSAFVAKIFGGQERHRVLFLTKSDRVQNLLDLDDYKPIVMSFSLNAEKVAERWEKGATPVPKRIDAAEVVFNEGCEVRVRIDPMVPVDGWETAYKRLVDSIFSHFTPERITLGTLRGLKSTINFCTDKSWVEYLGEEVTGWGRKIPDDQRAAMYMSIINYLEERHGYRNVALCKETEVVWKRLGLNPGEYPDWNRCRCNCVW